MTRAEAIVMQPKPMTDAELELHIQHCGDQMRLAYLERRRVDALDWLMRQNDAIKSRSSEQVRRMERERGLA
jgi:hypothetical protein